MSGQQPITAVEPHPSEEKEISVQIGAPNGHHESDDEGAGLHKEIPTDEEMKTLRRVSDKLPWPTFSIAFVELCERFSYYGTIVVCMWLSMPIDFPKNCDH